MADDSKGLFASLGQLASGLVDIAYTRLEILSTDLEEDRLHIATIFFLLLAAIFCLVVGVVIVITLMVFILWESHRLLALALLGSSFIAAGAGIALLALHQHKKKPRLFAASLAELRQDKTHLDKSQLDKSHLDKSHVDKTHFEESSSP